MDAAKDDQSGTTVLRRADDRPITSFELKVYLRAGLSVDEAVQWADAGIEPYQAEAFRSAGVDLPTARKWHTRGVNGVHYARSMHDGVNPEEAVERALREAKRAEEARERRSRLRVEWLDARIPLLKELGGELLVTSTQIAEIPGLRLGSRRSPVSPSMVSQWRAARKEPLFPAPVAGGRSPRFRLGEALQWLQETDRLAEDPSPEWYWLQAVRDLPEAMQDETGTGSPGRLDHDAMASLRPLLAALVATASVAFRSKTGPFAEATSGITPYTIVQWCNEASNVEDRDPRLRGLLAAHLQVSAVVNPRHLELLLIALELALAESNIEPAELLDGALDTLSAMDRPDTTTHPALAELMARLGHLVSSPLRSALDIACGEGDLLLRMANLGAQRVVGIDISPDATQVATIRLFLRDAYDGTNVRNRDALTMTPIDETFDLVLADSPLGKRAKAAPAWLRLIEHYLAAGSHRRNHGAVLVVPAGLVTTPPPAVRAALASLVEAVVFLPNIVRPESREPVALLVLSARPPLERHILVVDCRDFPLPSAQSSAPGASNASTPDVQLPASQIEQWLRRHIAEGRRAAERMRTTGAVRRKTIPAADAATSGIPYLNPQPLPSDVITQIEQLRHNLEAHGDAEGVARLIAELGRVLRHHGRQTPRRSAER